MDLSAAGTIATARAVDTPGLGAPLPNAHSATSVGTALEAALRLRAPRVHASTPAVRQLAAKVGRSMCLDVRTTALLDLAVRVRDIGMIALPDSVVLATARLAPEEWEIINRHPVIGAWLLEDLPVVAAAAPVVRSHHERWDGGGYPDGLSGDEIPLLSRVIAICDAFVALAHDRPHRRGMGPEMALAHLCNERGVQFDPLIVDALIIGLRDEDGGPSSAEMAPDRPGSERGVPFKPLIVDALNVGQDERESMAQSAGAERLIHVLDPVASDMKVVSRDEDPLISAVSEFEVVPAFAPAVERALATIKAQGTTNAELVAAVESDIGLTVAMLRRAQAVSVAHPITNVPDALAALRPAEVETAIAALPRAPFPWRTSPVEVLLHRTRVHAQAVMRAADRIARELNVPKRDDVLVAALLHDVGKLVLTRVRPDYDGTFDVRTKTPEHRMRQEERAPSRDHATLGAFMIARWGLPDRLGRAVGAHHRSEAPNQIATYVRLADMVAHHGQGDAVDRTMMLRLCKSCGLSVEALRNVLFDLPHSGGSWLRRAQPSPLTRRETEILRLLGQGKVYKVIGQELGVAASTVRSHLQNMYEKLGVVDRAQAVLRATEMGWI